MALEITLGVIVGFTIFVFIVVAFTVGLIIYIIYDRCRKKSGDEESIVKHEEIVNREPDGASWENPIVEFEEITAEKENNNVEEKIEDSAPTIGNHTAYPIPEEIERIPEGQSCDSDENQEDAEEEAHEQQQEIESTAQEVPIQIEAVPQENIFIEKEPEPAQVPPDIESEDVEMSTFPSSPIYAKIGDTQVEEKPKQDIGKLHNRINQFEDISRSSTLVRSTKKDNLDGVKPNVVSSLVTEFEASDNILLGRQMSDNPAGFSGQSNNWSNSLPKSSTISISPNTSSLNRLSNVQENRDSFLDADTGEPLYSVPDRSKKSSRRSNGPRSLVIEDAPDGANALVSPGIPPKEPGTL